MKNFLKKHLPIALIFEIIGIIIGTFLSKCCEATNSPLGTVICAIVFGEIFGFCYLLYQGNHYDGE